MDAWAKCDPLLLNECNPLRDSQASDYWKRHDPMEQYSSNPRNIRREKRIRTPPIQAESSTPVTPLTIRSKRSKIGVVQDDLILYQLQSEFLTAQKASQYTFDASSSNLISTSVRPPKPGKNISQQPDPSSPPPKRKRTQTVLGQAFEQEKKLKQAKINARKEKQSMK